MRRALSVMLLAVLLFAGCQLTTPPQAVTTPPPNGATDVNPATPVTVSAGKLTQVTLTNAEGKQVTGALIDDGRSWRATEPLGYGKSYTYTGTATGAEGTTMPVTGSFSTVKPTKLIGGTLNIRDGETVGIAAPIIL